MSENIRGKSANWVFIHGEPVYIGKEPKADDETPPPFLQELAQKVERWRKNPDEFVEEYFGMKV